MKVLSPVSVQAVPKAQRGVMLLEAMISILLFALGILAVVGLQSFSIRASSDAVYRSQASFLANQIISEMWTDNKATLAANYATGGPKYAVWKNMVNARLPGSDTNIPTITVGANNVVTVNVSWDVPGAEAPHSFVMLAQIN
jgi:type IV pilus assembly protein PilV